MDRCNRTSYGGGKEEIERMHAFSFTTVLKDAILTVNVIVIYETRTLAQI